MKGGGPVNIAMMCSMNTYTQTMKMQMKWQQKKASGNYTARSDSAAKETTEKKDIQKIGRAHV